MKFWDMTAYSYTKDGKLKINTNTAECWLIYRGNKFRPFYYIGNNQIEDLDTFSGDIIHGKTWSLTKDSVLHINDYDYIIKKINPDSLVLTILGDEKYFVKLVPSKNQTKLECSNDNCDKITEINAY